jgi:hypothetical protein
LSQSFEPFEFFEGAAVVAFGLGLVADDIEIAGEFLGHVGEGVAGGVGAISGELFGGDGFSGTWHAFGLPFGDIARGRGQAVDGAWSSDRQGRIYFAVAFVIVEWPGV